MTNDKARHFHDKRSCPRAYALLFLLLFFFISCTSTKGGPGLVPSGSSALPSVLLEGSVTVAYLDAPPSGGIVFVRDRRAIIDEQGFFALPLDRHGDADVRIAYGRTTIAQKSLRIGSGTNRCDISVETIRPSLMVKYVDKGMTDDRIFRPVSEAVYHHGNTALKRVAITLDDGWSTDDALIDLMKENGIRCTVFIIGGRGVAEKRPDWIRRMDSLGFEVCIHTYSHSNLKRLSDSAIESEIRKSQKIISAVTGKKIPYLRPPMGVYDKRVIRIAAKNGYKLVNWNNAIFDYVKGIKAEDQKKGVLRRLANGSIILAHFGAYNTYEVLKDLIPEIRKRGFEIVTLSEVLEGLK